MQGLENFTVEDITFRNARKQCKVAEELKEERKEVQPENGSLSDIPQAPVIERAIQYYEKHAEGDYKVLYKHTAQWLREYLTCISFKDKKEVREKYYNDFYNPQQEAEIEEVNYNEDKEETNN